jgi:hypothetical protein
MLNHSFKNSHDGITECHDIGIRKKLSKQVVIDIWKSCLIQRDPDLDALQQRDYELFGRYCGNLVIPFGNFEMSDVTINHNSILLIEIEGGDEVER